MAAVEVENVSNWEWPHYNSVINRSDAAHKECENPFSPITRLPRNKKGTQVPRAPRKADRGEQHSYRRTTNMATNRRRRLSRFMAVADVADFPRKYYKVE